MLLQVASIQQEYPQHVACGMMSFIQQDPDTLEPMPGSQGTPGGEQSSQVRKGLHFLSERFAGAAMRACKCSGKLVTQCSSYTSSWAVHAALSRPSALLNRVQALLGASAKGLQCLLAGAWAPLLRQKLQKIKLKAFVRACMRTDA